MPHSFAPSVSLAYEHRGVISGYVTDAMVSLAEESKEMVPPSNSSLYGTCKDASENNGRGSRIVQFYPSSVVIRIVYELVKIGCLDFIDYQSRVLRLC